MLIKKDLKKQYLYKKDKQIQFKKNSKKQHVYKNDKQIQFKKNSKKQHVYKKNTINRDKLRLHNINIKIT